MSNKRQNSASELRRLYEKASDTYSRAVKEHKKGHREKAKKYYLEVIKIYGDIFKIEPDQTKRDKISTKCHEYKMCVEQLGGELKNTIDISNTHTISHGSTLDNLLNQAQSIQNQAQSQYEQKNYAEALDLYTKAAEIFLNAKKETKNGSLQQQLTTQVKHSLERAEELKGLPMPTKKTLLTVRSANYGKNPSSYKLTQKEKDILKHTSNINGRIYLPWDETDLKKEFEDDSPFLDPDGTLSLSDKQRENFGGWKRPSEIMSNPKMIAMICSSAIKQDIVIDCSFVASLCVSAAYERKTRKQLITRCIFPQRNDVPIYNPSGKYIVKLIFNGIARKSILDIKSTYISIKFYSYYKVIDDLFPVSRDGTLMCTFSTNKGELWPSIIEKAYMKVIGGYNNFLGSNSGIDLHTLTGWIPELIFIDDEHFKKDNVWKRLLGGHKLGQTLITIATGDMTDDKADEVGLVPTHAYAVLDAREINGLQLLQVKNPWSIKRWTGPYSHLDANNWTPDLMSLLNYDRLQAVHNDDGIFWIDFDSVCRNFYLIHMNWNPELFDYHYTLHSSWPLNPSTRKDALNLGYNPQFYLEIKNDTNKDSTTFILLSKHITITGENRDFITLHLYNESDGKRIYYPSKPWKEGIYVNSQHILLRFSAPPGESRYTIVVDKNQEVSEMKSLEFTLKCYCMSQLKLTEIPKHYPIEKQVNGRWTEQTAGGNPNDITYLNNPQYRLSIAPSSCVSPGDKLRIHLMLEGPKEYAMHVKLVWGKGKRITSVLAKDILVQSAGYHLGFCYCEMEDIRPGDYTIVVSTLEPGLIGDYILTIASNFNFSLTPIPLEGAGLYRRDINGEWIKGFNAMGCDDNAGYNKNPCYHIKIKEMTTVKIRLQAPDIKPSPMLSVKIYEKHPIKFLGNEIGNSGPYASYPQGVCTNDVTLQHNNEGRMISLNFDLS
ncbi:cysteine proteinase [Gigaspora margarita]|uniref:Cysteine proteinase n=1 Tax=Gigaspora margarita TaxID=4874 RepID=A0A8H4A9F7_GIGMA|nr:cysteine proteinase [Gigaspora margarita]